MQTSAAWLIMKDGVLSGMQWPQVSATAAFASIVAERLRTHETSVTADEKQLLIKPLNGLPTGACGARKPAEAGDEFKGRR